MASDSASGRAVTSILPSSSASSEPTPSTVQSANSQTDPRFDGVYVPHIYDFMSLFWPAHFKSRSQIPSLYLEPLAVDHSITVGHGASFTTFKRAVPASPPMALNITTGDLALFISPSPSTKARSVVYKVARVAFTESGTPTPQTRHAMKAALMELYCLRHKPLQDHPNIVKLLDLAWAANYFDPSHRLPVAVVEFADRGNLAQLQETVNLGPLARSRLAIDIGKGLDILHRCGIVHGDVKSENILIFSDPKTEYVAKLSDFGFSLVGEAATAAVSVGGTRPWKAPEARSPITKDLLPAADVYSYGLLLWRLATDGKDPFRFWVDTDLRGEGYYQLLEGLKGNDQMVRNVSLDKWLIPYLSGKGDGCQARLTMDWLVQGVSRLQILGNAQQTANGMSTGDWGSLSEYLRVCLQYDQSSSALADTVLQWASKDIFYGRISLALGKCLSVDSAKRSLREALDCLAGGSQLDAVARGNAEDMLLRISYDNHVLSWQQMRELEPAVQSFIFHCFRAKVEGELSQGKINPPDCFILMSYCINGYGTPVDFNAATRLLEQCSNTEYNHQPSRAYVYRIAKCLNPKFIARADMVSNLTEMAIMGSRTAGIDLNETAPDKFTEVQPLIRDALAGVGANFFHAKQMLAGATYRQWVNTFDNEQVLVQNLSGLNRIADYKVNRRGDRILHLAASAGRLSAIRTLLGTFPALTVNHINDQGETPLLSACRAGQTATVLGLLELGADATVIAPTGETCLHWLVSFEDSDIEKVGQALVKAGAGLRGLTKRSIAYSEFRATIEVDLQVPGTPLAWAVHHDRPQVVKFLLRTASDPRICLDRLANPMAPSALEHAAYYHHVECLELMMKALEKAEVSYTLEPLLRLGVHSADTFSMILRHGARYKQRLHEFLELALRKAKDSLFLTGIGGPDTHLLYYAVSEGHDEVVAYLLSNEVGRMVSSFGTSVEERQSPPGAYNPGDINRPAREDRRTPVLEAIRWNRKPLVELLVKHGADPRATAKNPLSGDMNWTAFHILAAAGHTKDYSDLVTFLVTAGVPIDGIPAGSSDSTESPFLVAIQHNAFGLATAFLEHGANPNACSSTSGMLSLRYPTSVLGHIIAASAQHTVPRVRYLLEQCSKTDEVDFIVDHSQQMTALHRAAWAHKGLRHRMPGGREQPELSRAEYDLVINREIMHELLQKWADPETHLNARCRIHGRTALHMAVDAGNTAAVEMLVNKGADITITDELGLTPGLLARETMSELGDEEAELLDVYAIIVTLLCRDY